MKKIGLCHGCNLIQGVDSKSMLCDKCKPFNFDKICEDYTQKKPRIIEKTYKIKEV